MQISQESCLSLKRPEPNGNTEIDKCRGLVFNSSFEPTQGLFLFIHFMKNQGKMYGNVSFEPFFVKRFQFLISFDAGLSSPDLIYAMARRSM